MVNILCSYRLHDINIKFIYTLSTCIESEKNYKVQAISIIYISMVMIAIKTPQAVNNN